MKKLFLFAVLLAVGCGTENDITLPPTPTTEAEPTVVATTVAPQACKPDVTKYAYDAPWCQLGRWITKPDGSCGCYRDFAMCEYSCNLSAQTMSPPYYNPKGATVVSFTDWSCLCSNGFYW